MNSVAFVFPGQGSQAVGMGLDLCNHFTVARRTFEEADEALGFSLSALMRDGPAEALQLTEHQQPAILTVSVAAARALREAGASSPLLAAGHSLGEYSALVAAGALPFADAVRCVRERGRLMQRAVPVGEGAMAAVIGLDGPSIESIVSTVSTPEAIVALSGYNSPDQTTISGSTVGVQRASDALLENGARRVLPLPVSAPFHSPLMSPVERPLRSVLQAVALGTMQFPVVSNARAVANDSSGEVVDLLIEQVASPVRWVESIAHMRAQGVDTFVELGHGRALAGMLRKIDRSLVCHSVSDAASVAKVAETVSQSATRVSA